MTTYTFCGVYWREENDKKVIPILKSLEKAGLITQFKISEEVFSKAKGLKLNICNTTPLLAKG